MWAPTVVAGGQHRDRIWDILNFPTTLPPRWIDASINCMDESMRVVLSQSHIVTFRV